MEVLCDLLWFLVVLVLGVFVFFVGIVVFYLVVIDLFLLIFFIDGTDLLFIFNSVTWIFSLGYVLFVVFDFFWIMVVVFVFYEFQVWYLGVDL